MAGRQDRRRPRRQDRRWQESKKPGWHGARKRLRLRFEQLEERSLLAVAAFAFNLYEDVGGAPGDLINDPTFEAGDRFFVEITAQELDPLVSGLQGVALDLAWDPNVLKEVDSPFDPTALITPNLPILQSGVLDNEAGTIKDLRGSAFPASKVGRPIGNLAPEQFALLQFRAIAAGDSSISMNQGGSRIATMPVSSLGAAQLDFEIQTITVVNPIELGTTIETDSGAQTFEPDQVPAQTTAEAESPLQVGDVAVLGLQINLYEDANGVPGNVLDNDTVEVGESFFAEIAAQDLRDVPEGIGGLSVNVAWDPSALESLDQPFQPTDVDSELITADFPLFRSGSLITEAGRIDDLGGAAFRGSGVGQPIGVDGPQRFSLLHFRATAPIANAPFSIEIGDSGTGIVNGTLQGDSDLVIASQTITVLEILEPPRIEVRATSGPDPGTIEFTTDLGGGVSPLVRPAFPDRKQYVDVANSGPSPLTIHEIQVSAPDVTASAGNDLVLDPGETRRIHLNYAPTVPNSQDTSTHSFDVSNGLVIRSDAENAPQIEITLLGASTFDADINYDGRVNLTDVVRFDDHFGLDTGDASFDPATDPNGDGTFDMGDFGILNVQFGRSRPERTLSSFAGPPAAAEGESPAVIPLRRASTDSSPVPVSNAAAVDAVFGPLPPALQPATAASASDADDDLLDILTGDWFASDEQDDDRDESLFADAA